jgi:hypothetical protein
MKKSYLLAGLAAMMIASCSTEEQSAGGYVAGSTVTLNASLPNSGTRVSEASSDAYGLITNWSDDDSLDVLVNANTIVPMTKGTGNTFTATPSDATVGAGFNAGNIIYGVNNTHHDNITTALNGSQLKATLDFTGQNGTVSNLAKYDLMYGKGDPTGNITFNHKICVLRLDINSDSLKADGITSLTDLKLGYVAKSGTQLFATKEIYDFGATCDSTITSTDSIYIRNADITVADGKVTVYIAVPQRQNLYGTLYISMKGTNGTDPSKIYNLINPISMSNGRMLMSTVHPMAITGLSRAKVIGGYLFSDGWWGNLSDTIVGSVKPIAVIFSKTTSATDKTNGWTHGYAMALKNASTSAAWAGTEAIDNPTGTYINTTAAMIADKDGYTHTTYINSSTYPAAYAAATKYKSIVAAPSNTSGWYLPSIGQWYDICVNLGKMSATDYVDQTTSFYWSGSLTCASNINAYLTPLTSGMYETFPWGSTSDYLYWSSSEYNSASPLFVTFSQSGSLFLIYYSTVSPQWKAVRGVIAF